MARYHTSEMKNIHEKIEDIYVNYAGVASTRWKDNIGRPYGEHYEIAYGRFQASLEAAERARARRLDMAVLALSICGGTFLTAMLAKKAQSVLAQAALGSVGATAISRTMSALSQKRAVAAADYFIAGVYSEGKNQIQLNLSQALKSDIKLEVGKANRNVNLLSGASPLTLTRRIDHFLDQSGVGLGNIAFKFRERMDLSMEDKGRIYKGMIYSEFLTPPTANPYSDTQALQDRIELTLYLQFLLNTDRQGTKSIDVSPSDNDYPKTQTRDTTRGPRVIAGTQVNYLPIEKSLTERINELYQKLSVGNGGPLIDHTALSTGWGTRMDRATLRQAEEALRRLNLTSNNLYSQAHKTKRQRLIVDDRIDQLVEDNPLSQGRRYG